MLIREKSLLAKEESLLKRPRCEFMNVGLDINKMIRITRDTLEEEGMHQEAQQFMAEVEQARTMSNVFGLINKYVDTTSSLYDYLAERKRARIISLARPADR